MSTYNVLLVCGGGSDEHDISLISADYIQSQLAKYPQIKLTKLVLDKNGKFIDSQGDEYSLSDERQNIDFVIPCIHGYPGETGDIQSLLTINNLKFLGSEAETSIHCFNKVTAKQWFTSLGIPNTPYLFLSEYNHANVEKAQAALKDWGSVFIKASNQGSSVGCYKANTAEEVQESLKQAFHYSSYVLVEKTIKAREIEVAAYEYNGELVITKPGEIICEQDSFYDFDEKYSNDSKARTDVIAQNIDDETINKITEYSRKAFIGMKLRHLSRIDFFLTDDGEILLNEINTFPGMTPISMFPQMLINNGHDFGEYLLQIIAKETTK